MNNRCGAPSEKPFSSFNICVKWPGSNEQHLKSEAVVNSNRPDSVPHRLSGTGREKEAK